MIDHVVPGPDSSSNMQWQTAPAAKAKDKIELRNRGPGRAADGPRRKKMIGQKGTKTK